MTEPKPMQCMTDRLAKSVSITNLLVPGRSRVVNWSCTQTEVENVNCYDVDESCRGTQQPREPCAGKAQGCLQNDPLRSHL